MKVVATNKYQEMNITDATLGRIPIEGEEFEITEERYHVLSGNNDFNAVFVTPKEEYIAAKRKVVETAKKIVKKETAAKKTTKKTTKKKETK